MLPPYWMASLTSKRNKNTGRELPKGIYRIYYRIYRIHRIYNIDYWKSDFRFLLWALFSVLAPKCWCRYNQVIRQLAILYNRAIGDWINWWRAARQRASWPLMKMFTLFSIKRLQQRVHLELCRNWDVFSVWCKSSFGQETRKTRKLEYFS